MVLLGFVRRPPTLLPDTSPGTPRVWGCFLRKPAQEFVLKCQHALGVRLEGRFAAVQHSVVAGGMQVFEFTPQVVVGEFLGGNAVRSKCHTCGYPPAIGAMPRSVGQPEEQHGGVDQDEPGPGDDVGFGIH